MHGESAGSPRPPTLNLDAYPRTLGVVFLVLGLICGLVAFYFPVREALEGARQITLFSKAVFAFILFTLIGLIFIIFGPCPARLCLLIVGLLIVFFLIAGVEVQEAIQQYLAKFGYQVKFE